MKIIPTTSEQPTDSIVIFGGSFDPIHYGHIKTALSVQHHFGFGRFIFLPCNIPALKSACSATPLQRLEMLKLALKDYPEFEIDSRELKRKGRSFMIDTLISFRSELSDITSITLLIGEDAFYNLPHWHRWKEILDQCNLLVMDRHFTQPPSIPKKIQTLLATHEILDHKKILKTKHGAIVKVHAGHYPIASSELRSKSIQGHSIESFVPEKVYRYIKNEGLYSVHQ